MSSYAACSLTPSIERALDTQRLPFEIAGSVSPTLVAWCLAQTPIERWAGRPRLVVTSTLDSAERLIESLHAIDPNLETTLLEPFDESPYNGLYPGASVLHRRCQFLWQAHQTQKPRNTIFVAPIVALLQKTLPIKTFLEFSLKLKVGEEIDLTVLTQQLVECGYQPSPVVEDVGTFSRKGGLIDIYSPAHPLPVRIELFGDQIESLRFFDPESQRSDAPTEEFQIIPAREVFLTSDTLSFGAQNLAALCQQVGASTQAKEEIQSSLRQKIYFHGIDYFLPYFYPGLASPLDAFSKTPLIFWIDELEIVRTADDWSAVAKKSHRAAAENHEVTSDPDKLYSALADIRKQVSKSCVDFNAIHIEDRFFGSHEEVLSTPVKVQSTSDLVNEVRAARESQTDFFRVALEIFDRWKNTEASSLFVFSGTQTQAARLKHLFESHNKSAEIVDSTNIDWGDWISKQSKHASLFHIIPRPLQESLKLLEDGVILINEEDLFGKKQHRKTQKRTGTLEQRAGKSLFEDLNSGDLVVHELHGISVYEGLKKMVVHGAENEFLQLRFKDNDRLYLPIYRIGQIQKYSSPAGSAPLDKLGGTSWQKAKVKVRSALKDVANELLELYAKRQGAEGFSFSNPDMEFEEFEATFPYDETEDQQKAISEVLSDMHQTKPMDRLVCGDVGFGKTEVAIRAAFKAVQDHKQVAVLVPTTVLAFQHLQTFSKRMKDFPLRIASFSRFSSNADIKKNLQLLKEGKVDIAIGTHRLLSKDVQFKDLGLLVVDEEQKFGVTHKEKIKKFKASVDVLSLSATPIPRTLNMSLMGIRDLSLITTPPEDRLAIRTFVTRFEPEIIRKSILSEIQRGGQVFFIHNRVQSIFGLADELRQIVPEARIRVGHGQMPEADLEKTMLDFYNHEFDVLLCTTIIESGLDIPRANTIMVDRADTFGLSQLYQLRGRVGRSKERAYCYLLIPQKGNIDPTAQERLKILQEHSELGSGFHVAHYDLEMRGGGNILGEDQSGHIGTVGYELYMDLLQQALAEAKGTPAVEAVEPEINLRIPALIPDSYIDDIRVRLGFYRKLSDIESERDLDRIEEEMVDRFGQVPDVVTNLFGLMMIRKMCRDLAVRDISAGPKNVSLAFTDSTPARPEKLIQLAVRSPEKYQVTPDSRLVIRVTGSNWPAVLEELKYIRNQIL